MKCSTFFIVGVGFLSLCHKDRHSRAVVPPQRTHFSPTDGHGVVGRARGVGGGKDRRIGELLPSVSTLVRPKSKFYAGLMASSMVLPVTPLCSISLNSTLCALCNLARDIISRCVYCP